MRAPTSQIFGELVRDPLSEAAVPARDVGVVRWNLPLWGVPAAGHEAAVHRAGVADVDDFDGLETHDCFTPSEYLAIDHVPALSPWPAKPVRPMRPRA